MPNLTMSIPHQLSRDEVKRRIQDQVGQVQQQYGSMVGDIEQKWDGDTLTFAVHVAGQSITGSAVVEDKLVRVEVALPWMLSMLAGTVQQRIEQKGRDLLGHKSG